MLILLEFNDFNLRQSCYFSIHLIYMLILACSFLGFFFFFLYIYTPPWQRMVIKTKSVKYMPFYLSLANFTNGLIWVIYGLLDFDINLVVGHHRTETNFCFFFFHANYLQLTMKRLSVDLLTASQWLGCVIWADSAHTLWNLLQIDQIGWWWWC
jgi:hypothetical protein